MDKNSAIAYVYDFLSFLLEDQEFNQSVNEIILFGSVAKNTNNNKSDIDLFFNVNNKEEMDNI